MRACLLENVTQIIGDETFLLGVFRGWRGDRMLFGDGDACPDPRGSHGFRLLRQSVDGSRRRRCYDSSWTGRGDAAATTWIFSGRVVGDGGDAAATTWIVRGRVAATRFRQSCDRDAQEPLRAAATFGPRPGPDGTPRNATLDVTCGAEALALQDAREPATCSYRASLDLPAACDVVDFPAEIPATPEDDGVLAALRAEEAVAIEALDDVRDRIARLEAERATAAEL